MLILRGLNGLEPKKFEFSSPPTVLAILQTLNQHFDLFFKKHNLAKCHVRIIFKKFNFNFLVKIQSLYLCKYTNLFPIHKNLMNYRSFAITNVNYVTDGYCNFLKLHKYLFFCSSLLKACYFQITKD